MYYRKIKEDLECGIVVAMKVFGAKWKPCIIQAISLGYRRPSEIHRQINSTSLRVIEMQLSELMEYGVITKVIHPGFPLRVEYSLTELSKSILLIIDQLDNWGSRNKALVQEMEKSTILKGESVEA